MFSGSFKKAKIFAFIQAIVPQRLLSKAIGMLAVSEVPWIKNTFISIFRHLFTINLSEAEIENAKDFKSFNHFFTRALKKDARPLPEGEAMILSPADGVISECGKIHAGRLLQAKNHDYRLDELLPIGKEDWLPYVNGDFVTTYLAPSDYHRVHMPLSGRLVKTLYVPGKLYSVNQATAATIPRLFAKNERLIAFFDGPSGSFCMVLVGAMIVSGIESVFHGVYRAAPGVLQWNEHPQTADGQDIVFTKGDEFGRFLLGSTTIVLTPPRVIDYAHLHSGQVVRCRSAIGSIAVVQE